VDEALKRAFTDAYLRYEIAFAQFTTSNSVGAQEGEQQARYRELADAQYAFFQAASRLARSLSGQAAPPQEKRATAGDDLGTSQRPSLRQIRRSTSRNLFRL
jgi:hypothetical protein